MRVMLLQPFYFPWLGTFDMMSRCDKFIFYDDAQYSRGGWQSRNRIKIYNGVKWLSVGIDRSYKFGTKISEIKTKNSTGWIEKNLAQIKEAYRKAPFFDKYFGVISDFLNRKFPFLTDYTSGSIRLMAEVLGIDTKFEYSSLYNIMDSGGAQKVIDICKKVGADEYFDGASGREMYEPEFFLKNGIKMYFHEYEHPRYNQLYGEFVSHLSVLDLLLNEGPNSLNILRSGGKNQFAE